MAPFRTISNFMQTHARGWQIIRAHLFDLLCRWSFEKQCVHFESIKRQGPKFYWRHRSFPPTWLPSKWKIHFFYDGSYFFISFSIRHVKFYFRSAFSPGNGDITFLSSKSLPFPLKIPLNIDVPQTKSGDVFVVNFRPHLNTAALSWKQLNRLSACTIK